MKKQPILMLTCTLLAMGQFVNGQAPFFPRPNIDNDIVFKRQVPESLMGKPKRRESQNRSSLDSPLFGRPQTGRFTEKFSHYSTAASKSSNLNKGVISTNLKNTTGLFHLTRDINTSTPSSYPSNENMYDDAPSYPILNGIAYFAADDGIHGMELWRTDGTGEGTFLVKDIIPGPVGSSPKSITLARGKLFFSANTEPPEGWEPWISDGTEAGTSRITSIDESIPHNNPEGFVEVNGKVFMITNNFYPRSALFISDGTPTGTSLIYDFPSQNYGQGFIANPVAANGLLFFVAELTQYGATFWRSDGTNSGTFMIKDFGSDESELFSPLQLTNYDNKLYFSGDDNGEGRRLWYSDGTLEGTQKVYNPENVYFPERIGFRNNKPLGVMNGVLYFSGFTNSKGGGLYKFDASSNEGITLVKDLTSDPDEYDIIAGEEFKVSDNTIYFKVIHSGIRDQLWVSKGTENTTQMIMAFDFNQSTSNYYGIGGKLFFSEFDPLFGFEPWVSDGSSDGTFRLKDIFKGTSSSLVSVPNFFTPYKDQILFNANDGKIGYELWSTDGTGEGTMPVKDLNNSTTEGSEAGLSVKGIGPSGNSVIFGAFEPEHGGELYRSDGTDTGTVLVKDIVPGNDGSYPNNFIHKNGFDYFSVEAPTDVAIYKSDATGQVLQRVSGTLNWDIYNLEGFDVTDQGITLYIFRGRYTGILELWRSDGTENGTYSLSTNLFLNYGDYIVTVGDKGFFTADDGIHGPQLWVTDGTIPGTRMVKLINPGGSGSYPYSLFAYKNEVYFGAYDGTTFFYSLWKTDGTEVGTKKIRDITPAFWDYYRNHYAHYNFQYFCISGNDLFFNAIDFNNDPYNGAELWKTNGRPQNTQLVKNINLLSGSNPSNLVDVEGTLYFMADDGTHGTELWLSNGTGNGTKMVADISPGYEASNLDNLVSAGGKLYFVKDDGPYSTLWSADGAGNVNPVSDPALINLEYIQALTAAGNQLFFSARSPKFGDELFAGIVGRASHGSPRLRVAQDTIYAENDLNFSATLYPNPSSGPVMLLLTGTAASIMVSIASPDGQVLWGKTVSGNSTTSLPADKLPAGVYIVTVKSGKEQKILKLVRPR